MISDLKKKKYHKSSSFGVIEEDKTNGMSFVLPSRQPRVTFIVYDWPISTISIFQKSVLYI